MPRWVPGKKEKKRKVSVKRRCSWPNDENGNKICPLNWEQIEFIKKVLLPKAHEKKVYSIKRLAKRYKVGNRTIMKARDGMLDHHFEKSHYKAMSKKPETIFKKKVIDWIHDNLRNSYCMVIDQRALRGTPDLLCVINGAFVGIELKASIKETHNSARFKLQQWNLNKIRNANGYGYVVYPENWEKTKTLLKKLHEGAQHDIIKLQTDQKQKLQRGLDKIRES